MAYETTIEEDQKTSAEKDKGEAFNYDDILEHIGQMGKYQFHTFLWLCVPAIFSVTVVMSYTFTGGIPNYRCYIKGCDGLSNSDETNMFSPSWLNNTIPWNDDSPNKCVRYNYTWTNASECQKPEISNDVVIGCDRWFYDKTLFNSTIVTEFDLTCDNEWKQTLVGTVFMFGMLIGSAVIGNIADAIGRRLAFTLNVFVLATVTTASAFSTNFVTFCVLRFFSGAAAIGHLLILFVWGVEAVGKKYRVIISLIYEIVFSSGSVILGIVAYYVRDWKTLQLIISVPMFALVAIYWIVPESIRWLIIKKRLLEARQLIFTAAKMNKKIVPNHLLQIPNEKAEAVADVPPVIENNTTENPVSKGERGGHMNNKIDIKNESMIDVFRSPVLFKRLAIMSLAWFASMMGYFGITFAATNLSENFYLNYELSIVVEFPASIAGIFVIDKLGRRSTLSTSLIVSGVACLITGVVGSTTVQITFSMIGKLFISLVVATVFVFTSDLFPTPTRIAAMGVCSMFGRIGGILAPIIANVGWKVDPALPFIIFASVNISVGILCLLLPETTGISLPSTVQEAEDLEKYTFTFLKCKSSCKKDMVRSIDAIQPVT